MHHILHHHIIILAAIAGAAIATGIICKSEPHPALAAYYTPTYHVGTGNYNPVPTNNLTPTK